jgi:fumarate reductase subunit C
MLFMHLQFFQHLDFRLNTSSSIGIEPESINKFLNVKSMWNRLKHEKSLYYFFILNEETKIFTYVPFVPHILDVALCVSLFSLYQTFHNFRDNCQCAVNAIAKYP